MIPAQSCSVLECETALQPVVDLLLSTRPSPWSPTSHWTHVRWTAKLSLLSTLDRWKYHWRASTSLLGVTLNCQLTLMKSRRSCLEVAWRGHLSGGSTVPRHSFVLCTAANHLRMLESQHLHQINDNATPPQWCRFTSLGCPSQPGHGLSQTARMCSVPHLSHFHSHFSPTAWLNDVLDSPVRSWRVEMRYGSCGGTLLLPPLSVWGLRLPLGKASPWVCLYGASSWE